MGVYALVWRTTLRPGGRAGEYDFDHLSDRRAGLPLVVTPQYRVGIAGGEANAKQFTKSHSQSEASAAPHTPDYERHLDSNRRPADSPDALSALLDAHQFVRDNAGNVQHPG